jgi:hypothetical protein
VGARPDHSNGQVLMSIRRVLPLFLLGGALLSAACGGDAKGGPGDAEGMSSAEGAAEGSGGLAPEEPQRDTATVPRP